jgi:glycosidase
VKPETRIRHARPRPARGLLLLAWLMVCASPATADEPQLRPPQGPLHVPSPDWRDQVIYFVMIDRFDDGDPANNDQGAGEYDPADGRRYSGGDIPGITRRIDYIRGLGATAVWITPPVANQWWDGDLGYGGYHGYWAENFRAVDAHYGTLDDYRALSRALHGAGMYLIQDIVVNHTGNFFSYRHGHDADDPARHYQPNPDSRPVAAPTQWPFSLNDARDQAHRQAAIYHWTPPIADFTDRTQELSHALADLDDLNTANPQVRRALRDSYGFWIRGVGVDGFRVDTAFHVEADFFEDFMRAEDEEAPGMLGVARATGRDGFIAFGEGFVVDRAFEDAGARKLEAYVRGDDGRARLSSMINFPLYGSLGDVFARGHATAELGHRIDSMMRVHADPHRMPTFIDNHDVDRFLAAGSEAGLRQALLAMMTLPGIPTIYYGTEHGFREPRRAMFAGGYQSGGRDHFDVDAPLYRYIAAITALRREHRVLSRGVPTVLAANTARSGALLYRMDAGDDRLWIAFNTAEHASLLDAVDPQLVPGRRLQPLFWTGDEVMPSPVAGSGGRLQVALPPRAGVVWQVRSVEAFDASPAAVIGIDPLPARVEGDIELSGHASPHARFLLVLDGDLDAALPVVADADGRWRARHATDDMIDPRVRHVLTAWSQDPPARSEPVTFAVQRRWHPAADVDDPAGDDRGPHGHYRYPLDPGWAEARPADIHRMQAWTSGGALRFSLTMNALSAAWNPPNGFDRVAITAFIELPDVEGGTAVMPLQNAGLPEGMRWHYRLRAGGWTNTLFAPEGADARSEGRPVAPGARIDVDRDARTLTFTLPASALGNRPTLEGARLHVTTWDYDGGYRRLLPEPGGHAFGGGDGDQDPLVMDSVTVRLR